MSKSKINTDGGREAVKINSEHVEKVRANKKITGVPVCVFIEKAIEEKLTREKLRQ